MTDEKSVRIRQGGTQTRADETDVPVAASRAADGGEHEVSCGSTEGPITLKAVSWGGSIQGGGQTEVLLAMGRLYSPEVCLNFMLVKIGLISDTR